jgi:hypothetical protein
LDLGYGVKGQRSLQRELRRLLGDEPWQVEAVEDMTVSQLDDGEPSLRIGWARKERANSARLARGVREGFEL